MFPEIEYFFIAIAAYYAFYKLTDFAYSKNEFYLQLKPDRKTYFQKNIVKTSALICISIYGSITLYDGFINDNWNNTQFYRIGFAYAALDVLGLITVKNLPMNSKIHHISTFIFSCMNSRVDYSQKTFWVGLPIYCILSCYAFGVNLFLALRLIKSLKNLKSLILFNIISYSGLLLTNWLYQVYNIYATIGWNFTWDAYFFVGLVIFIANDDIKLVKFLVHHWKKASKSELDLP